MKWIRNYLITIGSPNGKQYEIAPPFSAQIDVNRAVMSSVNDAKVTLYNLAPSTRNGIYKDRYVFNEYWPMRIYAGYGEAIIHEIFRGNIQEAFSYKKGTEWITEITGYDGAYAIQNGFTSVSIGKGTSLKDAGKMVLDSLPGLAVGLFGESMSNNKIARGQVHSGSSWDAFQEIAGGNAYIDGEAAHVLTPNEVAKGKVFVLTGGDGGIMLETPRRREQYLEVNCLMSPEIRVGYICEIQSAEERYNGQYKVDGVKHSMLWSGASCGDATSLISLYKGAAPFVEVAP